MLSYCPILRLCPQRPSVDHQNRFLKQEPIRFLNRVCSLTSFPSPLKGTCSHRSYSHVPTVWHVFCHLLGGQRFDQSDAFCEFRWQGSTFTIMDTSFDPAGALAASRNASFTVIMVARFKFNSLLTCGLSSDKRSWLWWQYWVSFAFTFIRLIHISVISTSSPTL